MVPGRNWGASAPAPKNDWALALGLGSDLDRGSVDRTNRADERDRTEQDGRDERDQNL